MAVAMDVLAVVAPAEGVAGPPRGQWTYEDYAALPEDGRRYEVIQGVLYMTPSPGEPHQYASSRFVYHLMAHVDFAGLGRVYHAPFDVELAPNTVVKPDVLVILQEHFDRITPSRVVGAPDLVVELASPSTATHDRDRKLHAYERAGAAEYWIADPIARTVEVLVLEAGAYRSLGVFQGQATLPSTVVPQLPVRVAQFFT